MTKFLRLESGGRIDRQKPLSFQYDGKQYQGFEGDTLASALLANGVKIVGRSFKYHRPRGLFAAGPEEPSAVFQVGEAPYEEPNAKAPQVILKEGLVAKSVNCWPNADRDMLAVFGLAAPIFVAGFYYKTFKAPGWKYFSPIIRQMAGLGTLPKTEDPDTYDHQHAHCDKLIVGGGPSGLAAALSAARSGERIILVDEQTEFGGSLLWEKETLDGAPAMEWVAKVIEELSAMENVTLLSHSSATGYYDDNLVTVSERLQDKQGTHKVPGAPRERFWHVRATQVVLATGSIERPMVFPYNDRPGIMLASAMRHYVNRYAVTPGRNVLLYTNNDSAYQTAIDLKNAGVSVAGIVDVRPAPDGDLVDQARKMGITLFTGHAVINTKGRRGLKNVTLAPIDVQANLIGEGRITVECDALGTSGGWSPTVHLHSQASGKLTFEETFHCFVPGIKLQDNISVGSANGAFDLKACLEQGAKAGGDDIKLPKAKVPVTGEMAAVWDLPQNVQSVANAKRWVDLMHDVTANDVALAARENFQSVEHFKRYTTTGMAPDQGKTSNVNALAILGNATDRQIPQVGTTKFRPPYTPVTIGALGARHKGDLYSPLRKLPTHSRQVELGAVQEDYGGWLRPAYYAPSGENEHTAVTREVNNVRNNVGLLDYSPLGKIEVRGPDAAEFLNKFYVNNVANLKLGKGRYGLMLNDHGEIIDDGIFVRLADDHFWVMTTSGGAGPRYQDMEQWRQCEWPDMRVVITNITTGWGTLSIQGPKARDLLSSLDHNFDLDPENFPHMAAQVGTICGVPARLLRASFTGELGFEISIPVGYTKALWDRFMEAGKPLGLQPFGLEALMIMRTEKGYIHIGVDTDTAVIPDDIGFAVPARRKKADYIGRRSLFRPEAMREDREILVGLESEDGQKLPMGAIILEEGHTNVPAPMQGRVTSSYDSPTLKRPVALGLVKKGDQRQGEIVTAYDNGRLYKARIAPVCAYDPKGERINV